MTLTVSSFVDWIGQLSGATNFAKTQNAFFQQAANDYIAAKGYDQDLLGDVFKHTVASMVETFSRAKDTDYVTTFGLKPANKLHTPVLATSIKIPINALSCGKHKAELQLARDHANVRTPS